MLNRTARHNDTREQGFTLIELLVVIIIIGILAAIAIPVFLNQRQKGVDAMLKSNLKNAATAMETYAIDAPTATSITDPAQVTGNGFKKNAGIWVWVSGGPANGYCIRASDDFAEWFYYDSRAGGITTAKGVVPTGGACAGASTWTGL